MSPFPDDVSTAPLLRLSSAKLLARHGSKVEHFHHACEEISFFYLDLRGEGDSFLNIADSRFRFRQSLFSLPLEEKQRYDFSRIRAVFRMQSSRCCGC
jgi:isopenicillin N synthase-like dioxygenase